MVIIIPRTDCLDSEISFYGVGVLFYRLVFQKEISNACNTVLADSCVRPEGKLVLKI